MVKKSNNVQVAGRLPLIDQLGVKKGDRRNVPLSQEKRPPVTSELPSGSIYAILPTDNLNTHAPGAFTGSAACGCVKGYEGERWFNQKGEFSWLL